MGRAVRASKNGLALDEVCERYQASGTLMKKSISVVIPASLKESRKGSKSKLCSVSIITNLTDR